MAKKWQVYYNSGQGWRPYTNKVGKRRAEMVLQDAERESKRNRDGWRYKVFVVEDNERVIPT